MIDNPTYDDKELVRRIAEGDETAFRTFYDRHWNRVYTMALLYLKSPLAAQDAVQELFEKLWMQRVAFTAVDNPGGYLYVMARNLVVTELKKKKPVTALEPAMEEAQESNPLPDQLLDAKEISRLIEAAVRTLPPQQQKVYQLGKEANLPLKEVAATLGISYSTSREHMSYALKSIRQYLSEHLKEVPAIISLFFFYDC